jgi:hypothetical protein
MSSAEQPQPYRTADVRRPTLNAVAARAGVGRGTVSRVINGSPKVSDHSRAAVERAIAELGYVPNRAARSLATRRTDSVALVVPDAESRLFAEPYFSEIILGVSAGLSSAGMQLLLVLTSDETEYGRLAGYLAAQRVDGVLLMAVHAEDTLPDRLAELAVPTVLAGRRGETERLGHVRSDHRGGACSQAAGGPSPPSPARWTWTRRGPGSTATGTRCGTPGSPSRRSWSRPVTSPSRADARPCGNCCAGARISTPCSPPRT